MAALQLGEELLSGGLFIIIAYIIQKTLNPPKTIPENENIVTRYPQYNWEPKVFSNLIRNLKFKHFPNRGYFSYHNNRNIVLTVL